MKLIIFLLFLVLSKSTLCTGRIYYKVNCATQSLEYISESYKECELTRTGLESIGLVTNTTKYIDICGNQNIQYCVTVDAENKVYVSRASGDRASVECYDDKKYLSNLCTCAYELNSKCVNSQYFKLSGCISNGAMSLVTLTLLVVISLLV